MTHQTDSRESRVAVLVDCDNVQPAILDHALHFVAQFGRVVVRRGYGNAATLGASRWQESLVQQGFSPCLQYQYASGKNTSDIALALDAMELLFDETVDTFCLVTSDSDFAHLCRKLRERGAVMCIVGEAKTPHALRNASDHFSEWDPPIAEPASVSRPPLAKGDANSKSLDLARAQVKHRPMSVVRAVALLGGESPEGKVNLGALGNYLRRTDSSFSPSKYGYSGLLDMLRTYDLLKLAQEEGGHWTVKVDQGKIERMPNNPLRDLPLPTV